MVVSLRTSPSGQATSGASEARWWWMHVVSGCAWLLFGFAVVTGREEITTVWTVALLAGILLTAFAVVEFARAVFVEGWRWLHAVLAVASSIAAVTAFAWPGHTFLTLAALIGWYLLVSGVAHIALAYGRHRGEEQWWVAAVVGVLEVLLGVWAIGYPGRSIHLLVLWVALMALTRGLGELMNGFALHAAPPDAARGRR